MDSRARGGELNTGRPAPPRIAGIPLGPGIPRIIHQTYGSKQLPAALSGRVEALRAANPAWQHRLYDDGDVRRFIAEAYGSEIVAIYDRIDPSYGAARADLFRYLVIYQVGGVYLDIKSGATAPLDSIIRPTDRYLLSRWRDSPGDEHEGFGRHRALADDVGGELQQWYLAAAPGHPFLKAVIETVLHNIETYRPWRHGSGRRAVLAVTGPIAYTLAISPLLASHDHRLEANERVFGFVYSGMPARAHEALFERHYSSSRRPVIRMRAGVALAFIAFRARRKLASLARRMTREGRVSLP